MKHQWKAHRQFTPAPDGQRRWDQAYQLLLHWAVVAHTQPTLAVEVVSFPNQEAEDENCGQQQQLKELCRAYNNLVEDSTRIQNRLKALYRGRGIDCSGHALYRADQRANWLAKLLEDAARFRAASLLEQLYPLGNLA
jgi:hypothetical protein